MSGSDADDDDAPAATVTTNQQREELRLETGEAETATQQ